MAATRELAPALSQEQVVAASQEFPAVPKRCVVTGSSGFVGQRLVEMLVERGAERVVAFDIAPPPASHWKNSKIHYTKGDLREYDDVLRACEGADCVWHIAAAVGPFHPSQLYMDVNYTGTLHVINACKAQKVPKLVYSSSPSTRFDGSDVDGLREKDMPSLPQQSYLQEYARTKALGELEVTKACCDDLLTVSVAPHQVYGPRDTLFLPNMLDSASSGKLRVFGDGGNRICFSHVDNYCHGLVLGEKALYKGSPALGGFYVCTDGSTHPHEEGYAIFWKTVNEAVVAMGFADLESKMHLPVALMTFLAYVCSLFTLVTGVKVKLTPFTVRMITMHRWFDISHAEQDLKYSPIIPFNRGWADTVAWFKTNWLPKHQQEKSNGYGVLAQESQEKIRAQH
eukprot:TRINITY_DN9263_c0_g1_i2.p1 TRINITY_DN9263_c0_g1~~TRINITY_DN9263_c0_g1_i2.p1  ORF type:complete len:423 (+),score=177.02 TRINITY_DN9263_c0_g1_i2:78-1271(+)